MQRSTVTAGVFGALAALAVTTANAGPVFDQFRSGAFGVPWSAKKAAIESKYPGGAWSADEQGHERYCTANRQSLLKLPTQHQTRELCFLMGSDGTVASATARMDATLPALLAVVNRSRTMFGDFDAVRRDEAAIQSRWTAMLWTKDAPYIVQVASTNDTNGSPTEVTFTVADEAALYTGGAERVSHRPSGM